MLKKSIFLASAIVTSSVLPCFAGVEADDFCTFPFKVVGSSIGTTLGAPLGATKGGVQGSIKTTKICCQSHWQRRWNSSSDCWLSSRWTFWCRRRCSLRLRKGRGTRSQNRLQPSFQ